MSATSTLDNPSLRLPASEGREPLLRKAKELPQVAPPKPDAVDQAKVQRPRRVTPKKVILLVLALAAAGYGARYGWYWWTDGRFKEVTDDAFLGADKVTVAPKVGGFVAELYVTDNQPVHAGDVIARIDPRDYQVVLAGDEADLEKSKASLEGIASVVIQQQAKIVEANADVANAKASLTFAEQEARRYNDLVSRGAGTAQRSQQASSDLIIRQATVDKAMAAADAAQKQLEGLHSLETAARASLRKSEINLEQAKLNLGYTTVTAPIDGVVGDRSVRKGQLVQPGTNLLTVVPMGKAIYLIANYKETQVGAMHEGQRAAVTVDAFGDHVFHGRIVSFAPGTGSTFALLPPENATGNFTKIVQRVPVKIALDGDDPLLARLRPGLSAEATVDLRDGANGEPGSSVAPAAGQVSQRWAPSRGEAAAVNP